MRLLNYKVRRADGSEFSTTNYAVATSDGNKVLYSYFTQLDYLTEKERVYAEKVRKKMLDSFKQKEKE